MNEKFWNVISWLFGLLFLAIGLVNTFWGNDMGFGIFIIVLSLIFFPPLGALIKRMFGFSIHYVIKILIGLFIVASVDVINVAKFIFTTFMDGTHPEHFHEGYRDWNYWSS